MEEARRVLARLERIERLQRADAPAAQLLAELRDLLHEAETWTQREGGDDGEAAVERLRSALARAMIAA
jgi:hypothetical protein